ncbi:MAG: helix-turn-helix domain-containing protein [Bacteroidales bacterium]|jgi:transcriptional regulator with XRE-family HTH domain|nr:helix-turn-helix domain-containing protein [Bacteroidales bacterium]
MLVDEINQLGEIGIAIRSRRKELHITQSHLAELVKISVNTIYRIERGQANPSLSILIRIAETLGMSINIDIRQ